MLNILLRINVEFLDVFINSFIHRFFPGLAAYFIIGALYLKFVKHNSGAELIPNRGFWTSLPGDVKDGATFVKSKFISKSYSQI
jgi:hypothetical protein